MRDAGADHGIAAEYVRPAGECRNIGGMVRVLPGLEVLMGDHGEHLDRAVADREVEFDLNSVALIAGVGLQHRHRKRQLVVRIARYESRGRRYIVIARDAARRNAQVAARRDIALVVKGTHRQPDVRTGLLSVIVDEIAVPRYIVRPVTDVSQLARKVVRRRPDELDGCVVGGCRAQVIAVRRNPLGGTFVLVRTHIQREAQRVGKRTAQRDVELLPPHVAAAEREFRFELFAGVPGHVVDCAGERGAAECRALRAAVELDALHVVELQGSLLAHERKTVQERVHLLLGHAEAVALHAPHAGSCRVPVAPSRVVFESDRGVEQIVGIEYARLEDELVIDHGNGHGHFGEVLLAPTGRDDDFLQCRVGACFLCARAGHAHKRQPGCDQDARYETPIDSIHLLPLLIVVVFPQPDLLPGWDSFMANRYVASSLL